MSLKQPVNIFYDSDIPGLIDSNVSGTIYQTTVYPNIFDYGDYILRCRIYDAAPTTKDLSSVDTFALQIGDLGGDVFISANNASFNLAADWSSIQTNTGSICVSFDANVASLVTDIGAAVYKTYYAEIFGSNKATGDTLTVMVCPIVIRSTVGTY
jgi:hypothetical protein